MKKILFVLLSFFAIQAQSQSFYSFKMTSLDGQQVDFNQYKGKKVLVVNLAQKCGTAKQYSDLEALYKKYEQQNFIILGFPSSDFLNQAPGSNEELKTTCRKNFGFTFPIFEKLHVKGKEISPLYAWLTNKEQNGKLDSKVKWNTQKYMINADGSLEGFVGPFASPMDEKIISWIESK